ncbi:hypothetical protein SDC9_200948 [bioreactor metagenome]|uniref:Uncharacterized protein n=1 Tax=bioreactor metagenome TaxID=1076179 RepID=A0A645IYC6_9ZZZZ|nr:DUF6145 family protein [Candidatus Metalachnospira sp.]
MDKKVLAGASREKQKYFFEPEFNELPDAIKLEIKNICIIMAERLGCTFLICFEESGDIVFEVVKNDSDVDFDDIGAELEIKSLKSEKKELIKSLKLWYVINITEDGIKIKEELLNKNK